MAKFHVLFQLSSCVNAVDDRDCLPLDAALASGQESMAKTLVEHKADVSAKNRKGISLLHLAIERGA